MTEKHEFHIIHRPTTFKAIYGQQAAVKVLKGWLDKDKAPHVVMFTGPSGVGKTTLARILAKKLNCVGRRNYNEINSADFRGIDTIRDIQSVMRYKPDGGGEYRRCWIIDECHKLTPDAQEAALKLLEETPAHTYFFLCTTEPERLKPTFLSRCSEVKLKSVSTGEIQELIADILTKNDAELTEEVAEALATAAEGSPRRALVKLAQILELDTEEEQLDFVRSSVAFEATTKQLCQALINKKNTWSDIANILKNLDEEPERVRYAVLGYCNAILLGGQRGNFAAQVAEVMECFEDNFYDSKKAGLTLACFRALHRGKNGR